MPERYVSIPQEVDAVHWDGSLGRIAALNDWLGSKVSWAPDYVADPKQTPGMLQIKAGVNGAQGWLDVPIGHWVVSEVGDPSNIWPVDGDFFDAKYKPA